ncbi:hypothetical protein [Paenibacillus glacialis]|uniref:Uncharacterized protein n=1 Tax=Paenibacillus glacialis TaxID=494026 RepID=A0A168DAA4_9BACL|nr:hypothetical protein [Paenibacillus glacialis]OAB34022.1 hypothetical protein PGLA_24280 [Paenibacillus glacialis]
MKKCYLFGLILTLMISTFSLSHVANASSELPKQLDFTNVYEFEASTYGSLAAYDNVSFSFEESQKTTLKVNSSTLAINENLEYVLKKSKDEAVTLVRGSKMIDDKTLLSFNMVFDDISNANGNITITKEVIDPVTKQKDYVEKNIRFVNGVDSAQEIVANISENRNSISDNNIAPMASIDYPTNINYKYGNKFYAGYFMNQSHIVGNGGSNPMQIKIKPVGGAYSYTDATGATGSLKGDISGVTKINFRFERTSGVGVLTYPILKESPSRTFDIDLTYSFPGGIGIGKTLQIPVSGSNSATDGNLARWDLNDIYLDMEKNGSSVDAFYLYGETRGNGSGQVTVSQGASVTLGAVYVFGNKPAAIVNIKEDIPFTNKTITVK